MGILDGQAFEPAIFQQASEAATPRWLDVTLPSPGVAPGATGTGPSSGKPSADPALAFLPAMPQAAVANPFAALFNGLGATLAPPANGPSLGERANAAVMNFLNGRALLPAIGGALAGATTGERSDPVGLMQAQAAATVRALVGAGVRPEVAKAAALNPDIMRLIAPHLVDALRANRPAAPSAPAPAASPPAGAGKGLAQAGVAKPQYPTE